MAGRNLKKYWKRPFKTGELKVFWSSKIGQERTFCVTEDAVWFRTNNGNCLPRDDGFLYRATITYNAFQLNCFAHYTVRNSTFKPVKFVVALGRDT